MRRSSPRVQEPKRPPGPSDDVRAGLQRLRSFYERGAASLRAFPGRMKHGEMKRIEEDGVSGELLRKARAFADPAKGYTEDEFHELLEGCKRYGFALGTSAIIRLISVTRSDGEPDRRLRTRLQLNAIKNRWSMHRLNFEIARRFGRRQTSAGRRIRRPQDLDEARHQLSTIALRWKHLSEMIADQAASRFDVPTPVLRCMNDVSAAMERLTRELVE